MRYWQDIELSAGHHGSPADGLCLMEATALFADEPHSDWPDCVCPTLIEFGRVLNDAMPDYWRTEMLLPLVPILAGTRDPGCTGNPFAAPPLERLRARALVEWCVNVLPNKPIARTSEEYVHRADALEDAEQSLRFHNFQHATRAGAAALASTAKGVTHHNLGEALARNLAPESAAVQASGGAREVWESAVNAYRGAAMLRGPASIVVELPALERADG